MVKSGYKQTEIGVVPEDWEIVELGNIVKYVKGFPFRSKDYKQDGVRIIRISDTTYNSIKENDGIFVDAAIAKQTSKWKLDKGDLIISTVGSKPPMYDSMVGKVIYIKEKYAGSLLNQNVVMFKNTDDNVQILLSNIFNTKRYVEYIETIFRGNANQASITLEELFKFRIPIPKKKKEQQAIAEALSDADAWIESLEQLIAKKRLLKQGAMQELLTPKKDWEVKKLGDLILSNQLGGNYANSDSHTDYPLMKMGNIQRGLISLKKIEYISRAIPSKKDLLHFNDFLFNTRNTLELVGKVSIWRSELPFAYFNSNLMRITFKSEFISSNVFMNAVFNSKNQIQKLKDIATGTTSVAAIYTRDLLGLEISIPNKNEQTRIATILSDMDLELAALEQQLEKARQIKQGMMQELLTGKIRLV